MHVFIEFMLKFGLGYCGTVYSVLQASLKPHPFKHKHSSIMKTANEMKELQENMVPNSIKEIIDDIEAAIRRDPYIDDFYYHEGLSVNEIKHLEKLGYKIVNKGPSKNEDGPEFTYIITWNN